MGDYRSINSGNWTSTTVWEKFNGSTWNVEPLPPNSSTNVDIRAGHAISVDISATCDTLTINGSLALDSSGITVNGAIYVNGSLTDTENAGANEIYGDIIISATGMVNMVATSSVNKFYGNRIDNNSLNVEIQVFQVFNSLEITGAGTLLALRIEYGGGYTITNSSNVIVNIAINKSNSAGAIWDNKGTLLYKGAYQLLNTNGTLIASYSGNTITYNSTQDIVVPQGGAYWNLSISNVGRKTLLGNIEVLGDLSIESGNILDVDNSNNYDIAIGGNWEKQAGGTFDCRNGKVTFNGSANQSIDSSPNETFYDLSVDKVGGTLTLNSNIEVTNTLTMNEGNINSNSNILFLSNYSPSSLIHISGQVIGVLDRNINSSNLYEFPVGTTGSLNTLGIEPVNLSAGRLSIKFENTDAGSAGLPLNDGNPPVIYDQFPEGYWEMDSKTSFASSNYNLFLNTEGFTTYTKSPDSTRVIIRDSGADDWNVYGNHVSYSAPTARRDNIDNGIGNTTQIGLGYTKCKSINITTQPTDILNECLGNDTIFTISATGGGTISLQWQFDNGSGFTDIIGETNDTLLLTNISHADSGSYRCSISNFCGTVFSDTAELIPDALAPSISHTPIDTLVFLDNNCKYILPDFTSRITATDNCSPLVTFSQTPNSGTLIGQPIDTTIWLVVSDLVGNKDSVSFKLTVQDTIAPTIGGATNTGDTLAYLDGVCKYTVPDFSHRMDATDGCSGVTISQTPNVGYELTGHLTDTTVWLFASDGAGNKDSASFKLTVQDTIAPTIGGATNTGDTLAYLDGVCKYTVPDFSHRMDATDGCSGVTISQTPNVGYELTGHLTDTTVWLIASDLAGNKDSVSFKLTVQDTIAPTIGGATNTGDTLAYLDGGCKYTVPDFSHRMDAVDGCSGVAISQTPNVGYELTGHLTDTTVWLIASDLAGNKDSVSFKLIVQDTITPTIGGATNTGDTLAYLDGVCKYTVPDFSHRMDAVDGCSGVAISQTPNVGYELTGHLTDTTVWLIASDLAGNKDSVSFKLTVQDTIAPTIGGATNTGDTLAYLDGGCKYTVPDFSHRMDAVDGCSGVAISQTPNVGYELTGHLTDTTVWLIASDLAGNKDSVSFKLSVQDTTPPTAISHLTLHLNVSLSEGVVNIDTNAVDNGSFDNCGIIAQRSIDIDTFYCDDIGRTIPVTLTVWDEAGNSSTSVTNVIIDGYDTEPDITFNLATDTVLCSGETANIDITSNADSTSYHWTITTDTDITGWTNDSAIYPIGGDYAWSQVFVNMGDTARKVGVNFTSKLFNLCPQVNFDTTIYFWVSPELSVDMQPKSDTICNHDTLNIAIGSQNVFDNLRFKYEIVAENPSEIEIGWYGDKVNLEKEHIINDTVHNFSSSAQRIFITTTPYAIGEVPSVEKCLGTQETIEVWVEPTPRLSVSVADTITCDSNEVQILVTDLTSTTKGNKVYQLITTDAGGAILGIQPSGYYSSSTSITDKLINTTNTTQKATYRFISQIDNGGLLCGSGTDTTISIYVNPTPKLSVNIAADTIVCDSSEIIINVTDNNGAVDGDKVYILSVQNPGGLLGVQSAGEYSGITDTQIKDTLINLTDDVQQVTYTFRPRIDDSRNGGVSFCDNGKDTSITVFVNPTPRISVTVTTDTVLCDSGIVSFEIDSLILGSTGEWVYNLVAVASDASVSGYTSGDNRKENFSEQLINMSDDYQWVDYTFHPRINDNRGVFTSCDNGNSRDTTIRVYIEPYPKAVLVPIYDTICSGDTTNFVITSVSNPIHSIEFEYLVEPEFSDSVNITIIGSTSGLTKGYAIENRIENLSDTAQRVRYKVIPYTVDENGVKKCIGDTTFGEVMVEPALFVTLTPEDDTICSGEYVDIAINSNSHTSQPIRFHYEVIPENASEVNIIYDTLYGTGALQKGAHIVDGFINLSDTAQLVHINVTPYVIGGVEQRCPGLTTTANIWIEPTPKVLMVPGEQVLCSEDTVKIEFTSPTGATNPIHFDFTRLYNPDSLLVIKGDSVGLLKGEFIKEKLTNQSDTAQLIRYVVTPYTIDGNGNKRCSNGDNDTAYVWVEPSPKVEVSKETKTDTICDGNVGKIVLTSVSKPTKPINFRYVAQPEYPDSITISNPTPFFGLLRGDTIENNITNKSDTLQLVKFIITPYTVDGSGVERCSNGNNDTAYIWIEPTPKVLMVPKEQVICNEDTVKVEFTSLTKPSNPIHFDFTRLYNPDSLLVLKEDSVGLLKGAFIKEKLTNQSDTAQLIRYVVTPYTIDGNGNKRCSNGDNDTAYVWVEPSPKVEVSKETKTDTICDGNVGKIVLTSVSKPTKPINFRYVAQPEYPDSITISNPTPFFGLLLGDTIENNITNKSDTLQLVKFIITPYTVDGSGVERCSNGDNDTAYIWIEPTPKVLLVEQYDTLCNGGSTNITLTSKTKGSGQVRFSYVIEPVHPTNVSIQYVGADTNLLINNIVIDELSNLSDTAQLIKFIVTPYLVNSSGEIQCSNGINDTAYIWLEPTAKVHFDHNRDTICNGLKFNPIILSSKSVPTVGVRFKYQIIPQNPTQVDYNYSGDTTFLSIGDNISDLLTNHSSSVQEVLVVVNPFFICGAGKEKCIDGIADTVVVQLTPSLVMQDSAREYVKYNIRCHGYSDGAIYMYPTGGILAFGASKYNHKNLDYTVDDKTWAYEDKNDEYYVLDSIAAGDYKLKITDFSGCVIEDSIKLSQPEDSLSVEIVEILPVSCGGGGVLAAKKTGGTYFVNGADITGYSIASWTEGSGTNSTLLDTISNVPDGKTIKVAITDTNGCFTSSSQFFNKVELPGIKFVDTSFYPSNSAFNISCKGASDGKITMYIYRDTKDFVYFDLAKDSSIFRKDSSFVDGGKNVVWDGLPAGKYKLSVYTTEECKSTEEIELFEPSDSLKITGYSKSWYHDSTTNVSCGRAYDGEIKIDTQSAGRTNNYFDWYRYNEKYDSLEAELDSLPEGQYTIIFHDNYCYDTVEVDLLALPSLEFSKTIIDSNLCHGDSTGRIEVEISGGKLFEGKYKYDWAHDSSINGNLVENLVAGNYPVTVTDSNNCSISDTITVIQPDTISFTGTISNHNGYALSCYDADDGGISINAVGGTGAFEFIWSSEGEPLPNTSELYDLSAGSYTLIIRDDNNCEVSAAYTLEQPDSIDISFIIKNKVCQVMGEAKAKVVGGVPLNDNSYSYEWLINGSTTSMISNLQPGKYPLRVTDKNSCTATDTAVIIEERSMSFTTKEVKPISCNAGSDAILEAYIENGTSPYIITWNGTPGEQIRNNVSTGWYNVDIEDSNKCQADTTFFVDEPKEILADFTTEPASCYDTLDGLIYLGATGGNGGYSYYLNGEIQANGEEIQGLHAGEYQITIKDIKGCSKEDINVTVGQPEPLEMEEIASERIKPLCPDSPNGLIKVEASGGTLPYEFKWISQDVDENILGNVSEGTYTVRVTDINGCFSEKTMYLGPENPACLDIPNAFSPNGDTYNDVWDIINPLDNDLDLATIYPNMIIKIYNRSGQVVWVSEKGYPSGKAWTGINMSGKPLPVDSYHYIVNLNNGTGRTMTGIVTIIK